MKSTFKRSDIFGENFSVVTTFEIEDDYLEASYRNAFKAINDKDVVVKGFRPGKAPKDLLDKQKSEQAKRLAKTWIARDLKTEIEEDPDLVLLSDPVQKGEQFSFEYRGWRYPEIDLSELELDKNDIRGSSINFVSSRYIPQGIEAELMKGEVGEVLKESKYLREAIACNVLSRSLKIDVTDEEVDSELGLLAVREGKSFAEVEEGRDIMREALIQRKVFETLETIQDFTNRTF